jgi:hypothetical protein
MRPGGQFFMTQRGQFRVAFDTTHTAAISVRRGLVAGDDLGDQTTARKKNPKQLLTKAK